MIRRRKRQLTLEEIRDLSEARKRSRQEITRWIDRSQGIPQVQVSGTTSQVQDIEGAGGEFSEE